MRKALMCFLCCVAAYAQPGFYRADSSPAIRWGRQDSGAIVEHYISPINEATISSSVTLAFTGNLALANDRYWLWKDTAGTNIGVLGMTGSDHVVFGTQAAPAGSTSGDVLFYRRGALWGKITAPNTLTAGTDASIGDYFSPFRFIVGKYLWAAGTSSGPGELNIEGHNRVGIVTLAASRSTSGTSDYVVHLPAGEPTVGQSLVVQSGDSSHYDLTWGTGIGLPVVDTTAIVKGSVDATKLVRFEVDGLTPSTTRVLTPQDTNYTLAGTDITNLFTASQTLANDRYVSTRDTAGTSIPVLGMTGDNYLILGTYGAPTGSTSGDVAFYRRGTLWGKITAPNTLTAGTDASIGDYFTPFRFIVGKYLWAAGTTSGPGELNIEGHNRVGTVTVAASRATGGTADYVIHLPSTEPAIGQSLVVASSGSSHYDLSWGTSTGLPVVDTTAVVKGSADATKLIRLEADGLTTATTRVLTPQDSDYILAGTNINNLFSTSQTLANDRYMLARDTASTAIQLLGMNGSNHVVFGTQAAPTGPTSGDLLFYRRGELWAKITANNTLSAGTNANIGDTFAPFRFVTARYFYSKASSTEPGEVSLEGLSGNGVVSIAASRSAGGTAGYYMHLPSTTPTVGQSLVVQAADDFAGRYDLTWGSGGGVTYPLDNTATGNVSHTLRSDRNTSLLLEAYSSTDINDRGALIFDRAYNTPGIPGQVAAGARLGVIAARGYLANVGGLGAGFGNAVLMTARVDSVDAFNTWVAGKWEFSTTNTSGTNAIRWVMEAAGNWVPGADNSYTIGATGTRPSTVFTRNLDLNGSVMTDLIPDGTGVKDFGSTGHYWKMGYFTGLSVNGTGSFTGLTLSGGIGFSVANSYNVGSLAAPAGTTYTYSLVVGAGGCSGCGGSGTIPWTAVPSNIIPSSNIAYDIGSSGTQWLHVYAKYGEFSDNLIVGSAMVAGNNSGSPTVQVGSLFGGAAQLYFNSGSTIKAPGGVTTANGTYCGSGVASLVINQGLITSVTCN